MALCVQTRRRESADAGDDGTEGAPAERRRREAHCSGGNEARTPGDGDAADFRPAASLRRARRVRDDGPPDSARGRTAGVAAAGSRKGGAAAEALRAGGAEPVVAVGHLHVPAAPARAALRDGLHGRLQPLHRRPRTRPPSEVRAGDGGLRARRRVLRRAARSADGQRAAIHDVARRNGVRGRAEAAGRGPHQEPAAAPADPRQGGALLEDVVGRIPFPHGLRRLRGLPAADEPLHRRLQLPPAASGHRRAGAGRPFLPRRTAGADGDRGAGGGERDPPRAAAAAAQALLPGGPAGGPDAVHRRGRRAAARPDGRPVAPNHSPAEGDSR